MMMLKSKVLSVNPSSGVRLESVLYTKSGLFYGLELYR